VDPAQERFHGTTTIDLDVPRRTSHVVLHGRGLNVTDVGATFGSKAISGTSTMRAAHGATVPEELVLIFPEPIEAGKATITIAYDAPFADDLSGVYRVKEGSRWYAFTQFESTAARRAFPCFDEPALKATFDVSVHAPKGMLVVANTPEKNRADDASANTTRFDFATTPPLSSYLVAFAVGDLDVRDGPTSPVPIRLVSTKGKAALGDFALDAASGIVKKLGDYFALPYPFAKLDLLAVPDFAAGAMENPGLITFREELVLQDAKHTSLALKRGAAETIAHELAHMWFGDLVTMQWWNDVWLNEGFATWMETRATDAWRPEYGMHLDAVDSALSVMDLDALGSARAVRQPAVTSSEIEEAFDGISYEKGAAVLAMLEHWLGEETFQKGVRDYVRGHAWKNATSADLLGALDRASGKDVSGLAATFLDRPGVPLVALRSSCGPGKVELDLAQSPWRPLGVQPGDDASPWTIPVCVHEAGGAGDECVTMTTAHATLATRDAKCPAWTYPNAASAGYYRFALSEPDARALAHNESQLDAPSRIGLVSNLWASVRSGDLAPNVALGVLPSFDRETSGHVVTQVVHTLYEVDKALVDDASRPAFRAYVAARMAGQKRRLGWQPTPGEDAASSVAREQVLLLVADVAHDPATIREADVLARRWLADPASVDADVAPVAVRIAAMGGDATLWNALRVAAGAAKVPAERIIALRGLGAFQDPKLLGQTFDLMLTDEVKMQDMRYLLGGDGAGRAEIKRPETARALFVWLNAHWEQARAKMPGPLARDYAEVLSAACSPEERDAEVGFFHPRMADVEGTVRPMAEWAEAATACAELRARGASAVATFLKTGR
jgi:alanyl aminopeptidase